MKVETDLFSKACDQRNFVLLLPLLLQDVLKRQEQALSGGGILLPVYDIVVMSLPSDGSAYHTTSFHSPTLTVQENFP